MPNTRIENFVDDLTVTIQEHGVGSGRPILVLHGARGPESVAGFAEAMGRDSYVIAPTHPGFDGTARPAWFDSIEDIALTYIELLDRLHLNDALLVGFSFGGWIASELAVRASQKLRGIILVDAAGIQVEGIEVVRPGPPPALRDDPKNNAPSQNPERDGQMDARMQAIAAYAGQRNMQDPKLRRRLGLVTAPALVIWGENDPIIPLEYGRSYADAFPNGRFEAIPQCGHMPQLEQPERVLALARDFDASIPA